MKDQNKNKDVNPIAVTVAGAVVGAGIAVAGVMLSKEKNRKKVKEVANKLKNDTFENMVNIKKQTESKKKELEKKFLEMSAAGLRVVALAEKHFQSDTLSEKDIHSLTFIGFVGRYGFAPFAWYRIVIGLVMTGLLVYAG